MEIRKKLDFIKHNKLNIFYKFLQLICCFVILYSLANVKIFNNINPFGIVMFIALIWVGYNPLIIGAISSIAYYIIAPNLISIKLAIAIMILSIILFLFKKFKRLKFKYGLIYILCIIILTVFVFLHKSDAKQNISLIIASLFSILFLYICQYFFNGTLKRGFSTNLNADEKICGAIIITLIAFGCSNITLLSVEWATVVCVLAVLLASYTFSNYQSLVLALLIGLGVALASFNPIYIAFYACFALFAGAFRSKTKIFSSLSVIIVYLFFTMYFSEDVIFSTTTLIAVIVVAIAFVCLPNKLIRYMRDLFAGYKDKLASRNVVKASKDKISKKLIDVSKVFKEMEFSFKRTLQKTLPIKDKKELMKQDLVDVVCKYCPNYNKCLRVNGEYTTQVFNSLIDAGVNKGRVSEVDLNNYIYTRCPKVSTIISSANEIITGYREYNMLANNMDCSKVLVAEQFKGVSNLMQSLAKEINEDITFDTELEDRIMQDLLYKNIFVEEVVVYERGVKERSIILLCKNSKINRKILEKIVSKACKTSVRIVSIEPSEIPNQSVIYLYTTPNYDIVYGSSTCNKAGTIISGDTHSFIKIDNGKYMLALSDGMGSGSRARETSDLSIGLIENYYKAGFDSSLILSSVNKLLSFNNEESFSAIDLCIFDFFNNTMDFIKLGTPRSYIKRKTGVEVVESSGLPIGILEEFKPHITKKYINNFDTIILVSDGVADAFNHTNLKNYINNLNIINPQELADSILAKAKSLAHNVCEDDMTVLVARIFPTK